jgi:general secretion pathway protein I
MKHPATRRAGLALGFTLIEVLVALSIIAVALGAGMRAAGVLTDNSQRLADLTVAQWCADNHLVNLRLSRQFPNVGEGDFACRQMGVEFTGKLIVRPTPNPNFRRVEAVISDAAGRPVYNLATVMLSQRYQEP